MMSLGTGCRPSRRIARWLEHAGALQGLPHAPRAGVLQEQAFLVAEQRRQSLDEVLRVDLYFCICALLVQDARERQALGRGVHHAGALEGHFHIEECQERLRLLLRAVVAGVSR